MKRVRKLLLVVTVVLVASLFMGKVRAHVKGIYKITASKDVSDKIAIPSENETSDYCPTALAIDGVTNCEKLTLGTDELLQAISNETVQNTVYYVQGSFDIDDFSTNITIPKGVTLSTFEIDADDKIVTTINGTLKAAMLSLNNGATINGTLKVGAVRLISGTGNLILNYGVDLSAVIGTIPDDQKAFIDAFRFMLFEKEIPNIKIGITGTEIKDGLVFGFIDGLTNGVSDFDFTEADRKARLKQLNNILDESISKDYEVVMQSSTFKKGTDEYTAYYGVLKSKAKPVTVTVTTKNVTNPKTGDAFIMITSLIGLISVGSFMALRKIKRAN